MYLWKVDLSGWKCFETCTAELTNINVLLGRNNSGKSTFVRAIQALQPGVIDQSIMRLGSRQTVAQFYLKGFDGARFYPQRQFPGIPSGTLAPEATMTVGVIPNQHGVTVNHHLAIKSEGFQGIGGISPTEPNNFLYLYLSKRKAASYNKHIDLDNARSVTDTFQNLVSKVAALANPGHPEYRRFVEVCEQVLDIPIGTIPVEGGAHVGLTIGRLGSITLEAMGDGVSSLLALITDLCVAEGNLFLLEEPENDIHPQGLKALLDVIIEKSASNQFIVSTHSNIVAKYLGSAANSQVLNVELVAKPPQVPTSELRRVEGADERIQALRSLGYDLYDFDLADGWIFFEEASAEGFVRDYLIPWFAPKLKRISTVSAYGTSDVEPTVRGFDKLFLFIHRSAAYRNRAWVLVDGDDSGKTVIERFHKGYAGWPTNHFRYFSKTRFEGYYPEQYQARVAEVFALPKKEQQEHKIALSAEVRRWCDEEPEAAKAAFEVSAAEVIGILEEIEAELFPQM